MSFPSILDNGRLALDLKLSASDARSSHGLPPASPAAWNRYIKIIYLPPYSPELNPVERLWRWIKRDVLHNVVYQTLDQLMVTTENCINSLKRKRLMSLCSCNYL
jgi:transposase